uniref:Uncharacterized protein n=1 Tax=Rhizophora mucronata TaxID=61149 RepID=A0A2P2J7J4_RHIMU
MMSFRGCWLKIETNVCHPINRKLARRGKRCHVGILQIVSCKLRSFELDIHQNNFRALSN